METPGESSSVPANLCDDAIAEILVRLPSESVLRCRAVCKSWRRITTERSFLAAHAARRPREMIIITHSMAVSTIPLSLDPTTDGDGTGRRPFLCDPAQRRGNGTATWWRRLLFSLDGLLVLEQRPGVYIICNPATRQWTNLPVLASIKFYPCGFYFHSASGEYRLLCHGAAAIGSSESEWTDYHYILAAGAAKPRRLAPRAPAGHHLYQVPVAHRGILHWFCMHPEATRTGKMLAFDTVSETFRLMARPPGVTLAALLELDGALCAATEPCATRLDIWVLQDYETESWALRLRMEMPPAPICVTTLATMAIPAGDGTILIGDQYCRVLRLCDLKEKRVREEMDLCRWATFQVFSESLVSHAFFDLPRCPGLKPLKFTDYRSMAEYYDSLK